MKKDRTNDLHPSIKNMIENALATECNKPGELCEKILSLYNSKIHGGLDIQLHQLFDNIRMGKVIFSERISTIIWAGFFTRIHKSAPGPFSPILFSEMKAIRGDKNKNHSLLIKIFSSTEGSLMKSMKEVKSLAKTTVTVPQDFYSIVYQLREFAHASSFFFSNKSILAIQLKEFVANIKGRHSITKKKIELPPTTPLLPKYFVQWTVLSNSSSKTAASVLTKNCQPMNNRFQCPQHGCHHVMLPCRSSSILPQRGRGRKGK